MDSGACHLLSPELAAVLSTHRSTKQDAKKNIINVAMSLGILDLETQSINCTWPDKFGFLFGVERINCNDIIPLLEINNHFKEAIHNIFPPILKKYYPNIIYNNKIENNINKIENDISPVRIQNNIGSSSSNNNNNNNNSIITDIKCDNSDVSHTHTHTHTHRRGFICFKLF
eukprot:GHVR01110511.1.p1 GENE.GHVR01110511.1~~GHVR01110511.1.p1  ORF type:complete len:172 (+),score=79.05 GHVR01110511.1:55-570(+)